MSIKRFIAPLLMLALSFPAMAAEYVYATKDVTARRFQDSETLTTGDVKTNDKLEVVYKTEGWVRVRIPRSPKFGWVPADAVTNVAPAGVEETAGAPGGLEGLSPEMQKMIQEKLNQMGQGAAPESE